MSGISGISSTSPYLYGHIASANRLMSAADGAAELAVTKKEEAQITGYNTGTKNLSDGVSLLKTTDGALGSVTDHLQRMRELALRASSSILNDSNKAEIQKEIEQLKKGIDQIAGTTNFNGIHLLNGTQSQGINLVSDAGGGSLTINNTASSATQALGLADFDVTKDFNLQAIDDALTKVTSDRSTLGAQSNNLEYAIDYNDYASVNLTASMSRTADTDIAKTLMELKHQQTLQSVTMMLQKRKMEQEGSKMTGLLGM